MALLALAPIAVVLAAMTAMGWSAARAGAAGLAVALAVALSAYDLADTLPTAQASIGIAAESVHSTAVILWIILPALGLYEYQRATGAIDRIRDALTRLTSERRLQAILIAWFFGLFMEGAAGFGTPVALAAPLLVGIGFAPVLAVTLALLGHAAAVSFGAVGTPVLTQAQITGWDAGEIAAATALLHTAFGSLLLLAVVRLAKEGPLTARDLGWTLLAAVSFFAPYLAIASFAGPELPSLGGALIGLALFAAALRRHSGSKVELSGLLRDLTPYLVIVALVLTTRLVSPLRRTLEEIAFEWSFAGVFAGSFQPLHHPGTLLLLGLLLGAAASRRTAAIVPALRAALGRLGPVALALLAMLALSRVMVHSGMIDTLAGAAAASGDAWPLIAPAVGVLGTFVTGSATASNILFSGLQATTAQALSLPVVTLLAAQGFGAAIGNVIAPHNIIAGSATVGLVAREGEILAKTVRVCAIYCLAGGAAVWALAGIAPS